jgi:opacity protein-like surface antigen
MNMPRCLKFAVVSLLALACAPAYGQKYEVGAIFAFDRMSRAPLGTVRQSEGSDSDTKYGDGRGFGIRLTQNTKGYYGHEVSYVRSQINLRANVDEFVFNSDDTVTLGNAVDRREKVRQSRLGYNFLMYMMPAGERWRPYITIGVATMKTDPPRFIEWTSAGARNFGANVGAGIKLALVKNIQVRFDARQYLSGRPYTLTFPQGGPQGNLRQLELSGGVSFAFGK